MKLNKATASILIIAAILLLTIQICVASAVDQGATETTIQNTTATTTQVPNATVNVTATSTPSVVNKNWTPPLHIINGQCVPINSTVDVSELGWGISQITWYGRYMDDFNPGNQTPWFSLPMPDTPRELENFYIDPRIFETRQGYWYEYYPNMQAELSANLRFFYVNETCPIPPLVNYTVNLTMASVNETVPQPLPWLPQKKESDILIAYGDHMTVNVTPNTHYWMFGYDPRNYQYDTPVVGSNISLNTLNWTNWAYGDFKIAFVSPGASNILEEIYNPAYVTDKYANTTFPAIESPFRNVQPINIYGLDPMNVLDRLQKAVAASSTGNNITTMTMEYQKPYIEIDGINGLENPTNDTFIDVRGYTNVVTGTPITLTIDTDKLNAKTVGIRQFTTIANGTIDPGVWREFDVVIPMSYSEIPPGEHNITASVPEGAQQTVSFYIYQTPGNSYVPPQYINYIGASPYITPNTVTVTVTVPGPTKTIVVTETPSDEQIRAAAKTIVDKSNAELIGSIEFYGVITIIISLVVGYTLSVIYRRRKKL